MTTSMTRSRIITALRWIARIASALFALALLVLLTNGITTAVRTGAPDWATLTGLLVVILALVGAWVFEFASGVALVLSGAVVLASEIVSGVVDGGPFLVAGLGALFLVCWWGSRRRVVTA